MKRLIAKAKHFGYPIIEKGRDYIIVQIKERKEYWDTHGRINSV